MEHRDEVLAYLRRLLGQRAEDAWQETFLRALRAYDRLEHGGICARGCSRSRRESRWTSSARSRGRSSTPSRSIELRRDAFREIEHLTDDLPPDRARCRRAPVRLRPSVRRHRRRPRLVRGGGPRGRIVRRPQTEEEPMTVDDRARRTFPCRRDPRRARRRPLRRDRLAGRRAGDRRDRPRPLSHLVRRRTASTTSSRRVRRARPACAARRRPPRARRVLRGHTPRLRPTARPPRRAVPRGRARSARDASRTGSRRPTARSRARSGTRRPPGRSGRS